MQINDHTWLAPFQKVLTRWEVMLSPEQQDCFRIYLHELDV